jgi:hypothetical protein
MVRKIIFLLMTAITAKAQKDSTVAWGFMAGINLTQAYPGYNRSEGPQGGSSGSDYETVSGKGKSSKKYAFNAGFIFSHRKKPRIKLHVGYMASVFQFNYSHSAGYNSGYGPAGYGYYGHTDGGTGTTWRNCVRIERYHYTENKFLFIGFGLIGCFDNISKKGSMLMLLRQVQHIQIMDCLTIRFHSVRD